MEMGIIVDKRIENMLVFLEKISDKVVINDFRFNG